MSLFSKHRVACALAATVLTVGLSAQALAGPMGMPSNHGFQQHSQITDVRYAPRHRGGGNGGAVAAAALGIMALGIGAAIANSNREPAYYPAYGDGYGYGYAPAPVYVDPPAYYAPRRFRSDGNYWQQKARDERDRKGY